METVMNVMHKDDLKIYLESIKIELISAINMICGDLKGVVSFDYSNKFTIEKSDITLSKNFADLFIERELYDSTVKSILGYLTVAHCINSIHDKNEYVEIKKYCSLIINNMCKMPVYDNKCSTKESYLSELSLRNQCFVLMKDLYEPLKAMVYNVVKKQYKPRFSVEYVKTTKELVTVVNGEQSLNKITELSHFEIIADQIFDNYSPLDMTSKFYSDLFINTDRNYKIVLEKSVSIIFNRTHDLYKYLPDLNDGCIDECVVKDGKQYRASTLVKTNNELFSVFRFVPSAPPEPKSCIGIST
jgi:hypothetical protein